MLTEAEFTVAERDFHDWWDARHPAREGETYQLCRESWITARTPVNNAPEFADTAADLYDLAGQQFNTATEHLRKTEQVASKLLVEARTEYDEAEAHLRSFEEKPGVPKPEYRRSHA
jgi:hypothetical protein